jgi:hypothetical protein
LKGEFPVSKSTRFLSTVVVPLGLYALGAYLGRNLGQSQEAVKAAVKAEETARVVRGLVVKTTRYATAWAVCCPEAMEIELRCQRGQVTQELEVLAARLSLQAHHAAGSI